MFFVTYADRLNTYEASLENDSYEGYAYAVREESNAYDNAQYTLYDQASQQPILWIPRPGDAIATSVYRDYDVNSLFDDDNATFWLSDFGSETNITSIEVRGYGLYSQVFNQLLAR